MAPAAQPGFPAPLPTLLQHQQPQPMPAQQPPRLQPPVFPTLNPAAAAAAASQLLGPNPNPAEIVQTVQRIQQLQQLQQLSSSLHALNHMQNVHVQNQLGGFPNLNQVCLLSKVAYSSVCRLCAVDT